VATLFIDHASCFFHLSLHSSTGAQEGIDAKNKFERAAKEHGITIKEYHANNRVYQSKLFRSSCDTHDQNIAFCGINECIKMALQNNKFILSMNAPAPCSSMPCIDGPK